jgi:hypothetical protein
MSSVRINEKAKEQQHVYELEDTHISSDCNGVSLSLNPSDALEL